MNVIKKIHSVLEKNRSLVFPAAITFFILIMTSLQLSGTSTGVYDIMFGIQNDNILSGEPRGIRSDEWMVTTPFIASQVSNGFPEDNSTIGHGQDMSMVVDVPYLDWSMFFKPQNLSFFILPLENALAFKWWFLAGILCMAVYLFVLLIYPRRYLVATAISIFFLFSPFIQWWFQSITILPIAYGLLLLVGGINLIRSNSVKVKAAYTIALTYLAICFALLMYPAFQIPIAIIILGLFISVTLGEKQTRLVFSKQNVIFITAIIISSLTVVGIFLWQHLDSIQATLNTIYPGSRNVESGGFDLYRLLTWTLSYALTDTNNADIFLNNQSEASGFILLGYIALPFLLYKLWRRESDFSKTEKYLIYTVLFISLILTVRLFTTLGDYLFSIIGLSSVPHTRLMIAIGLLNMVIVTVLVARSSTHYTSVVNSINIKNIATTILMLSIYSIIVLSVISHFNIEFIGPKEAVLVILSLSLPTTFLLLDDIRFRYFGLALLTALSIAFSYNVNPLHRGTPLADHPFVSYIKEVEQLDNNYWISNDNPSLSALLMASGAETYGGVNTYPQTPIWSKHFKDQEDIWNRYSHVRFEITSSQSEPKLELIQSDSFRVKISACHDFMDELNIRYIVSETELSESCLGKVDVNKFGNKILHTYRRNL